MPIFRFGFRDSRSKFSGWFGLVMLKFDNLESKKLIFLRKFIKGKVIWIYKTIRVNRTQLKLSLKFESLDV